MDPRIPAGTLPKTDNTLAEVKRILEAATARGEDALKATRRREESEAAR